MAGAAALLLATLVCIDSRADGRVPAQLQAKLVARLATFDRNFQARAGQAAQILVVYQAGNVESTNESAGIAKALGEMRDVGGLPPKVQEVAFTDAASLATRCRAEKIALVYFVVGLEGEMPRVAAAFSGVDVLTAGTSARHVENGSVVGFSLEESRPKIVLRLKQARAQNVDFKAEVLKLARIVD